MPANHALYELDRLHNRNDNNSKSGARSLSSKGRVMPQDSEIADDLIPGSLKRSKSYHHDYGMKSYGEIKKLAVGPPPDKKARQMK